MDAVSEIFSLLESMEAVSVYLTTPLMVPPEMVPLTVRFVNNPVVALTVEAATVPLTLKLLS